MQAQRNFIDGEDVDQAKTGMAQEVCAERSERCDDVPVAMRRQSEVGGKNASH